MEGKSYRIWLAVLVLVLMVGSFVAGAGMMYSVSQESVLGLTARVAQMVPGVMAVEQAEDIPSATDLRPLATFWQVRDRIQHDFVHPIQDDTKLTYGAIRGMLAALEDPYSRFMTPEEYSEFQAEAEGHFEGIGAWLEQRRVDEFGHFEVVVISVIPEGPASKVDLRPSDIIFKVDDKSVLGMTVDRVAKLIRGPEDTEVKLTVLRGGHLLASPEVEAPVGTPEGGAALPARVPEDQGQLLDLTITRATVEIPPVETKILDDNIGYVWLRTFHKQAETKLHEALKELLAEDIQGLVFDLSGNGGGLLEQAISVTSLFMDEAVVVYVQERGAEPQPYKAMPGRLVPEDLPMVILTDVGSASASEITAAALQDSGQAKVVGQHTFGKAKVQTVMELNDHSALVLTTALYLTPNKRDLSQEYAEGKRGIKPDVVFPLPDPDQPFDGEKWHDQQIEKARQVLKQSAGPTG